MNSLPFPSVQDNSLIAQNTISGKRNILIIINFYSSKFLEGSFFLDQCQHLVRSKYPPSDITSRRSSSLRLKLEEQGRD